MIIVIGGITDTNQILLRKFAKCQYKLKDLWSFTIEYDCRVVFYFTNDKPKKAVFVDVGTHDEVY
jgi:mRNA-degrading endonuclease YafQ of YafQ-DinJ toxin-antitoxin module